MSSDRDKKTLLPAPTFWAQYENLHQQMINIKEDGQQREMDAKRKFQEEEAELRAQYDTHADKYAQLITQQQKIATDIDALLEKKRAVDDDIETVSALMQDSKDRTRENKRQRQEMIEDIREDCHQRTKRLNLSFGFGDTPSTPTPSISGTSSQKQQTQHDHSDSEEREPSHDSDNNYGATIQATGEQAVGGDNSNLQPETPEQHQERPKSTTTDGALSRNTIEYEEVLRKVNDPNCQDKHFIAEYPHRSGNWYILQCVEHNLTFADHPLRSAAAHLNSGKHQYQGNFSQCHAVQKLGIRVLGCSREKATSCNEIFRRALASGYQPNSRMPATARKKAGKRSSDAASITVRSAQVPVKNGAGQARGFSKDQPSNDGNHQSAGTQNEVEADDDDDNNPFALGRPAHRPSLEQSRIMTPRRQSPPFSVAAYLEETSNMAYKILAEAAQQESNGNLVHQAAASAGGDEAIAPSPTGSAHGGSRLVNNDDDSSSRKTQGVLSSGSLASLRPFDVRHFRPGEE